VDAGSRRRMLPTTRELGIAFVAYSPLGRGFLTGDSTKRFEDLAADDYRRFSPRFQGENFQKNLDLVARVEAIATERSARLASLRWLGFLAQGQDIIPIPGPSGASLGGERERNERCAYCGGLCGGLMKSRRRGRLLGRGIRSI